MEEKSIMVGKGLIYTMTWLIIQLVSLWAMLIRMEMIALFNKPITLLTIIATSLVGISFFGSLLKFIKLTKGK